MKTLKALGTVGAAGAAYTGHMYYSGRIGPHGHSYRKDYTLGPVTNYGGSCVVFWKDLQENPNGKFPMTRVSGNFKNEGDIVYLQFAMESPNPVRIYDVQQTQMTLTTEPGHVFSGQATHGVYEEDGYLHYTIEGRGPESEPMVQQIANVAFADLGWHANLPITKESQGPTVESVTSNFE